MLARIRQTAEQNSKYPVTLKGVCIWRQCKECQTSKFHNFTTFRAFPVKSKYVREEYWSSLCKKIDPQYVHTKGTHAKNGFWANFWLIFDFLCRMCAHTYFFNFLFHTHWYHYQMCKILRFQTNRIKIDEIVIWNVRSLVVFLWIFPSKFSSKKWVVYYLGEIFSKIFQKTAQPPRGNEFWHFKFSFVCLLCAHHFFWKFTFFTLTILRLCYLFANFSQIYHS